MHRSVISVAISCFLPLPVGGCSGPGPQLVNVRGQVLDSDGKPVFPGSIWFVAGGPAASAPGGVLDASSMLYEDGSFKLRTYPHGDGAMVGRYRVTLSLGAGSSPKLAKYAGPRTTPLTVDVPQQGLDNLVLHLDSSQRQGPAKSSGPSTKRRTR
jgi:hypothetical protein